MSKFEKNMEEFFDVTPRESENLPEKTKEYDSIPHETLELDLKKDYEVARENIHELIEKSKDAIDDILAIARESNERMMDLHKKVREISNYKNKGSSDGQTTIKNALFVGSTSDLSKLVKQMNEENIKDVN
jgi:predicted ATP-grasp superfamily ATP-dependent carboligase